MQLTQEKSVIPAKGTAQFEGQFHITRQEGSIMHKEVPERAQQSDEQVTKKERSDQKKQEKAQAEQQKMLVGLQEQQMQPQEAVAGLDQELLAAGTKEL